MSTHPMGAETATGSIASRPFALEEISRLPDAGDNCRIASRRVEAGSLVEFPQRTFRFPTTILEGHRFASERIAKGEALLSWGLPFGHALRDIHPGEYICNEKILAALRIRGVDFALPEAPNFVDYRKPYELDKARFLPGEQVPRHAQARHFAGYARPGGRGVGTRNYIVVLGTNSLSASFVRAVEQRFKGVKNSHLDGIVAVAHTEGGGTGLPSNFEFTMRTLAGFCTHPNVGAVLMVDFERGPVNNHALRDYLQKHKYPIEQMPHAFLSLNKSLDVSLADAERIVRGWIEPVSAARRTEESLEHLRLGLQCGGSDAFSGVSGNPLAGWVSRELVRYGGSPNLAETDELIGAEPYILSNVRDLATAETFLEKLEAFQARAAWHGQSAEGNPSGGNNFRGLYNIAIKSIGAARKKDPEVRLDYVIDYAQPMRAPGFYFMDSPGNDLESIAGQVGAGCNLILFTTGNGSITNFPFVPTIKVMTTTARYNMLSREMDFNAGRYQDGESMDELGREAFKYMIEIASGKRSAGEEAGHSQVQLWREWRQKGPARLEKSPAAKLYPGEPIPIQPRGAAEAPPVKLRLLQTENGLVSNQVGLIVPTSLCSGQIGKLIASQLNAATVDLPSPHPDPLPKGEGRKIGHHPGSLPVPRRFAALAHTEGCGVSGGECEEIYLRTITNYLLHPLACRPLLLEHGCEKTHNDAIRHVLREQRVDMSHFGWASIQMDGGLEKVSAKARAWFEQGGAEPNAARVGQRVEAGLDAARVGVVLPQCEPEVAEAFGIMIDWIVQAGGTVVIPEGATMAALSPELGFAASVPPSLGYGQKLTRNGFHVMETPTDHFVETLTGLGATGVEVMITFSDNGPAQGHPLVPLIQAGRAGQTQWAEDFDLLPDWTSLPAEKIAGLLLEKVARVLSGDEAPKLSARGYADFQMTRGRWGVSL